MEAMKGRSFWFKLTLALIVGVALIALAKGIDDEPSRHDFSPVEMVQASVFNPGPQGDDSSAELAVLELAARYALEGKPVSEWTEGVPIYLGIGARDSELNDPPEPLLERLRILPRPAAPISACKPRGTASGPNKSTWCHGEVLALSLSFSAPDTAYVGWRFSDRGSGYSKYGVAVWKAGVWRLDVNAMTEIHCGVDWGP